MRQGSFISWSLGVALALSIHSTAWAATTDHTVTKEDTAEAIFDSWDPAGCIETFVFVGAASLMQHDPPGGPKGTPGVVFNIFQNDLCTGAFSTFFGEQSPVSFRVGPDLTSATLQVRQVPMVDVESNELFYVDVNITWTSTDTVTRQAFSEVFHPPGGIVEIHGVGFTRPAQAVGTLTNGTTNYIPEPSNFFGQIQRLNDGEIDVTH